MKETDKKRKREHEFKYKANKKQYEFNSTLKEDLEDILKLVKEGSKHRSSKKIKEVMKWGTVVEYESDSVASDSEDEKKIRAAERRALQKQSKKRKLQPSSTITRRVDGAYSTGRPSSGRPSYKVTFATRSAAKPTDICLKCGDKGHWKRDCAK